MVSEIAGQIFLHGRPSDIEIGFKPTECDFIDVANQLGEIV
jgi:hypothetical protein